MPKPESSPVLVVDLWPHKDDCAVCGAPADPRLGVPMYEGELVGQDATEWGGFPACLTCYCQWLDLCGVTPWQSWVENGNRFAKWGVGAKGKPVVMWRY